MNTSAPPLLLSLPELAQALNLPKEWLRTEADAGRLPCLRVGRRYRFNHDAVVRNLAERARQGQEMAHA